MKNDKPKIKCTHCEAVLKGRVVYLELDQRTGTYTNRNIPDEFSQGAFPFGVQCSKIMLVEDIMTVTKPQEVPA